MPKPLTKEEAYDRCNAEGKLVPTSEVDTGKVEAMINIAKEDMESIKELKKNGIRVGVASSSKNCQKILQAAKIEDLFETRVDGIVSAQLGLNGKPEGDIFVKAALNLDSRPPNSVVVEDAVSGVQAGRNGGFKLVLGVARENNEEDLLNHGADVVVRDLASIDLKWINQ